MQSEKINPKMFTLAREARGYSQVNLSELSKVSRQSIGRFELGDVQLASQDLTNIMDVLKFSEALYKLESEIMPPPMYRRREKVSQKLLDKIDARTNIYSFGIARLLKATGFDQPNVPLYPVSVAGSPEEAAILTRKAWKMDHGVITNLTAVLEANGFIILPVDFETERIDSLSVLIDDQFPVIFYNKKLLGDRLRFTLAHELAHIVMHTRNPLTTFKTSRDASLFASAFLMPKKDILKDIDNQLDVDKLAVLKSKWLVSMHALLYRAEDLNVITENQKRYLINAFNKLKIRRREPKELDVPIERGQLLRDLITKYRSKQKMNVKQIADFFYMREEEFLSTFN